jgi:hypothetical protein
MDLPEPVDVLARARERRLAQQWEDVTARLLRDFAPAGGPDAEAVLATSPSSEGARRGGRA